MPQSVLFSRRFSCACLALLSFLALTSRADAQGIGFLGGATIDPEQFFVGTHLETGELVPGLRFRPGIDGSFGEGPSLASINVEFVYSSGLGRSDWSLYQGGGPAVVLVRQVGNVDVRAGSFFTFGFSHRNGFFTELKYGGGASPTLKFAAGFTVRKAPSP